jgi:riboflavin synthase
MFTGLIEQLGRVERVGARTGGTRLAIRSGLPVASMKDGESVAVDGVCLTVARRKGSVFEADAIPETLARSTLGTLRAGDQVHLERALAVGDRLGGHLVQGHVDAVARVRSLRERSGDVRLEVALPRALAGLVAMKGSIAIQGVSLTIAGVTRAAFTVALIPETLERTLLGRLQAGSAVNVEVDLIARYLEALMRQRGRARLR